MIQCAIETGAATLRIGSKACVRDSRWRMDGDCHGKVSRGTPRRHSASCVLRGCHDGHSSELIRHLNRKERKSELLEEGVEIILVHPDQHELAQKSIAVKADRQLRVPHCPHRTLGQRLPNLPGPHVGEGHRRGAAHVLDGTVSHGPPHMHVDD